MQPGQPDLQMIMQQAQKMQEQLVGALHDAARAAQQLQAEKMGPLAGGLGGDLGGLGLPGF